MGNFTPFPATLSADGTFAIVEGPLQARSYSSVTIPAASVFNAGTIVYNSTAAALNISDGANWNPVGGVINGLLAAYQAASAPAQNIIGLTSALGPLLIRNNASPIGTTLFGVQNAAGSQKFFDVTSAGASVRGTFSTSGLYSASGGIASGSYDSVGDTNLDIGDSMVTGALTMYGGLVSIVQAGSGQVQLTVVGGVVATAPTDGTDLIIGNVIATESVVDAVTLPAAFSPAFLLQGSAWNTSLATGFQVYFSSYVTTRAGNPASGDLVWLYSITQAQPVITDPELFRIFGAGGFASSDGAGNQVFSIDGTGDTEISGSGADLTIVTGDISDATLTLTTGTLIQATSIAPTVASPFFDLQGQAWNGAASIGVDWMMYVNTHASASPTGDLVFRRASNSASFTLLDGGGLFQNGAASNESNSATAGSNGAVPAQVVRYLIVKGADGTTLKIPCFAA